MKKIVDDGNGNFTFCDGDEQLCTPGGTICTVRSKALAKRILNDWKSDPDSFDGDNSLPWIYTYQENFLRMGADAVREIMVQSFKRDGDWTFHCPSPNPMVWMNFRNCFGEFEARWKSISEWLNRLNLYQLTAACCVGNAFQSLNVAFVFAFISEAEEEEPGDRMSALDNIANYVEVYEGEDKAFVKRVYSLFELFFTVDNTDKTTEGLEA